MLTRWFINPIGNPLCGQQVGKMAHIAGDDSMIACKRDGRNHQISMSFVRAMSRLQLREEGHARHIENDDLKSVPDLVL